MVSFAAMSPGVMLGQVPNGCDDLTNVLRARHGLMSLGFGSFEHLISHVVGAI